MIELVDGLLQQSEAPAAGWWNGGDNLNHQRIDLCSLAVLDSPISSRAGWTWVWKRNQLFVSGARQRRALERVCGEPEARFKAQLSAPRDAEKMVAGFSAWRGWSPVESGLGLLERPRRLLT